MLQADNKINLLLFVGMCVLYSVCSYWLLKLILRIRSQDLFSNLSQKRYVTFMMPAVVILFSFLFILDMMNQGMVYRVLPISVQQQVSNISIHTSTAQERIILASDSLKLIQDAPILGHGGEAWGSIYQTYQSLPYQTNKIHNGYLDWTVSNGLVGLILFLFVWSYFYFSVIKNTRKQQENTIQIGVLIATLMIFVHSVIDFNFSYGTVWFLVIWLFVIGLANDENQFKSKKKKETPRSLVSIVSIMISVVIVIGSMVMSFRFMLAHDYYQSEQSGQVLREKEILIEKALNLDQYHLNYWLELGEIKAYQVYKLSQLEQKNDVEKIVEKMIELEPNNPKVYLLSGSLMEKIGENSKAIRYYEQSLALDHYNATLYEKLTKLKVEKALQIQSPKEKELLLDSAIAHYEENVDQFEYYEENKPANSKDEFNSRDFQILYNTKLHAAKANFYKKDYLQTIYILKNVESDNLQAFTEGLALQYVAYQRVGKQEIAENLITNYQGDHSY